MSAAAISREQLLVVHVASVGHVACGRNLAPTVRLSGHERALYYRQEPFGASFTENAAPGYGMALGGVGGVRAVCVWGQSRYGPARPVGCSLAPRGCWPAGTPRTRSGSTLTVTSCGWHNATH